MREMEMCLGRVYNLQVFKEGRRSGLSLLLRLRVEFKLRGLDIG